MSPTAAPTQRISQSRARSARAAALLAAVFALSLTAMPAHAAETPDPNGDSPLTVTIPAEPVDPGATPTAPPANPTAPANPGSGNSAPANSPAKTSGSGSSATRAPAGSTLPGTGAEAGTTGTPAATEPALPTLPGTGSAVIFDKEMYLPSENVTATASGFTAGEQVQVVLFSEPILIGNFTADAAGAISVMFTLPKDQLPGTHTLQFTGWASKAIAVGDFMVGTDPQTAGVSPEIAPITWWIAGGLAALAALIALFWFGLRALRGDSDADAAGAGTDG
ncbi:hypothetical protein B0I08_10592 [Glaciihabitans tibetensis]|uniref:Methionine-rich copper-binding protein CopC n=1 Tax=Glaciihabitans tibetensis TaxID=1266600 RepID=A0A2T0VCN4_9MICO|nr:hypothetical protein [Glaciihabitans tibetensis]PRY67931.1 hypothetical protein B0I08_10592 [Glaciihabitans tibetensis]